PPILEVPDRLVNVWQAHPTHLPLRRNERIMLTGRGAPITSCPASPRSPGGGIGRRAGFRYLWPQGRGSSSLLLGTNIPADDPAGRESPMTVHLHTGDLPASVAASLGAGGIVAVDTETMGLRPDRDRLCLVQLSGGDGDAHLVQF